MKAHLQVSFTAVFWFAFFHQMNWKGLEVRGTDEGKGTQAMILFISQDKEE